MSNVAGKFRRAIQSLGPVDGVRFATEELFGPDRLLSLSLAKYGSNQAVLARSNSTDLAVFSQVFKDRDYQFEHWTPYWSHMNEVYKGILASGKRPLIVDGGANAGYSAVWFALQFPEAAILAIEPDPANFAVLQKNVSAFKYVQCVEAALWDVPAKVSVVDANDGAWGRRFDVGAEESADGPGIPSVTVRELINRDPDFAPFIMKIDIEGAEVKLLRSNTEWVDEFPLMVFEPHDTLFHWLGPWQGSGHSFFSTLSRRPREYLARGENIFAFLHPQAA